MFFPNQPPPHNTVMMAELRGELVQDERGCLRVRDEHGTVVPVWPPGFKAETSGGRVSVLDARGGVVGRVGEPIYMGGGELPWPGSSATANATLEDEAMVRELWERCPGSYWLVGTGVKIPTEQ